MVADNLGYRTPHGVGLVIVCAEDGAGYRQASNASENSTVRERFSARFACRWGQEWRWIRWIRTYAKTVVRRIERCDVPGSY